MCQFCAVRYLFISQVPGILPWIILLVKGTTRMIFRMILNNEKYRRKKINDSHSHLCTINDGDILVPLFNIFPG